MDGKGLGWGYFGSKNGLSLTRLINNKDLSKLIKYVGTVNIPPQKEENMLGLRSDVWKTLRAKNQTEGWGDRVSFWPAFHRKPSRYASPLNDTLITIVTVNGTKEEEKMECIRIMADTQEVLLSGKSRPDNDSAQDYWKNVHEFFAARHHYQVFLLDDNT